MIVQPNSFLRQALDSTLIIHHPLQYLKNKTRSYQPSIDLLFAILNFSASRDRLSVFYRHPIAFFSYVCLRFYNDNCFQRAAALTYTTLLGLVPLLTVLFLFFSTIPTFSNLTQQAQEFLFSSFLPEVGSAVRDYIQLFMSNAQQSTAFGVIGLMVASIIVFWTIESAFATIWHISEARSLWMRVLSFWTVLSGIPILFATILSLSTAFPLQEYHPENALLWNIAPIVFETLIFTLFYYVIPNRHIYWQDAAIGALLATCAFELSKIGFTLYIEAFPAYQTIYGALSLVPIFLLWLYVVWCAVLFGAVITASLPEWQGSHGVPSTNLSEGVRMAIILSILEILFHSSQSGRLVHRRELVKKLNIESILIERLLNQLLHARWISRLSTNHWVLSRDLSSCTLYDLQDSLKLNADQPRADLPFANIPMKTAVLDLFQQIQHSHRTVMDIPLKSLFS